MSVCVSVCLCVCVSKIQKNQRGTKKTSVVQKKFKKPKKKVCGARRLENKNSGFQNSGVDDGKNPLF